MSRENDLIGDVKQAATRNNICGVCIDWRNERPVRVVSLLANVILDDSCGRIDRLKPDQSVGRSGIEGLVKLEVKLTVGAESR